jgi:hypothetical protein
MEIVWLIRSGIFLVAGLMLLFYPDRAFNLSKYLGEKLPVFYNVERDRKWYPHWGAVFIFISLILFVYAV